MDTSLMIIAVPCADPMRDCLLLLSCLTAAVLLPWQVLLVSSCSRLVHPLGSLSHLAWRHFASLLR